MIKQRQEEMQFEDAAETETVKKGKDDLEPDKKITDKATPAKATGANLSTEPSADAITVDVSDKMGKKKKSKKDKKKKAKKKDKKQKKQKKKTKTKNKKRPSDKDIKPVSQQTEGLSSLISDDLIEEGLRLRALASMKQLKKE